MQVCKTKTPKKRPQQTWKQKKKIEFGSPFSISNALMNDIRHTYIQSNSNLIAVVSNFNCGRLTLLWAVVWLYLLSITHLRWVIWTEVCFYVSWLLLLCFVSLCIIIVHGLCQICDSQWPAGAVSTTGAHLLLAYWVHQPLCLVKLSNSMQLRLYCHKYLWETCFSFMSATKTGFLIQVDVVTYTLSRNGHVRMPTPLCLEWTHTASNGDNDELMTHLLFVTYTAILNASCEHWWNDWSYCSVDVLLSLYH